MSANPTVLKERVGDPQNLERLDRWAAKVVAESAELPPELSGEDLREHEAGWYAEYFTLADGWVVAAPDDPAMRAWLLEEEGMSPELADAVLARMRGMAAAG
jgi:hypothetical protein